jgi:hypothetical protein
MRVEGANKPSYPDLTDEFEATKSELWEKCLAVASGDLRQLRIGDREINAPNNGSGYRNMPQNPKGIAWAIKQYKGFGGGWRRREAALAERVARRFLGTD